MGLLSTVVKAGIATKVLDQLNKPENQARLKGHISSATSRRSKS